MCVHHTRSQTAADRYATYDSRLLTVEPDYSGAGLDQYANGNRQPSSVEIWFVLVTRNTCYTHFTDESYVVSSEKDFADFSGGSENICHGSPYLFPIEHVWDMMGRRLHLPRYVENLTQQLEQICQKIPQETIRVL
ncbi:hypothetical protein TNCV_4882021 [Trichonephila clavipes]|nr:hypothetical protein TNCV_4882021 [Trichonephila clavipes]